MGKGPVIDQLNQKNGNLDKYATTTQGKMNLISNIAK